MAAAHGFPCDLAKALFPLTSAILPSSQTSWQTLRHAPKSAEDCTHFFFSRVIHRSIDRAFVRQSVSQFARSKFHFPRPAEFPELRSNQSSSFLSDFPWSLTQRLTASFSLQSLLFPSLLNLMNYS